MSIIRVTTQAAPRGRHASRLSSADRFWTRVEKGGVISAHAPHLGACWIWRGGSGADATTYGRFQPVSGDRRMVQAHRWAYETEVGPVPVGLHLDHLCRNRLCVRPAHLEPVTCRVNLLRGQTFNATNVAKTHCPAGHPYSPDNTYLYKGSRACRACGRAKVAAYRQRRSDKAVAA